MKLFGTPGGGKSVAQNKALSHCKGEIIVLTDAETLFGRNTIKKLVQNFVNENVGCVVGKLVLGKGEGGIISTSQGMYWNYEMLLRRLESAIGTLHTGSGVVMAFRKSLFKPFEPQYGDDCVIPLDILLQGYTVVHEDDAIAYDAFPETLQGELNARIRMTLRNFAGTLSRYPLLHPGQYPLIAFSILSHKIFRWLTPYFLLTLLSINLFNIHDWIGYRIMLSAQVLFYLLGGLGFIAEKFSFRVPVASQIFSFLLANVGFFIGVLKALLGMQVTAYSNTR
jgi:cellulose synthase/poly-beta-1,6-N-acetylglucosamine synthase-like glycosyltransferase